MWRRGTVPIFWKVNLGITAEISIVDNAEFQHTKRLGTWLEGLRGGG